MPSQPPTLSSFTAGDLVISIAGDGDGSGSYTLDQASPIVLQEVTTSGTVVGQIVLPETTAVVNGVTEYGISGEYGSASEGLLQLSADGQSLVIMGYGVNPTAFNSGGTTVYGTTALGQTTSVPGSKFTVVPRVVADISYNTTVDTSTALYNVFNMNNPRSVTTVNGTTFYVSGQGVKGDTTQGVFFAHDGASSATAIDTSTDTRVVSIHNGALYVSRDSTQGSGGTSNIATYGTTLPTSATTPSVLPGLSQSITLTAAQENSVNASAVGTAVNLSPESFFFASPTTLYVADGGDPKNGGIGDGGLQKWVFNGTTWVLEYTLSAGLNQVPDTATSGTTGLIGLTGTVIGGNVELFATNETIGELDQSYLYGITDVLSSTTGAGESFTLLDTAAPDTIIRGVSFAPTKAATAATATTISSGVTSTGLVVTSGSLLTVLNGGTAVSATILSAGSAVVSSGGVDSSTTIAQGGNETVLGSATGDFVGGIQLVSAATAVVTSETVLNGGTAELFLAGVIANSVTVDTGGTLAINGHATANNTVLSGGSLILESAKSTISGTLTFAGSGMLEETANISAGDGDLAVISGFGVGAVVDFSSSTAIGSAGSAAPLSTTSSGGNTIATVSGGGITESFIFGGTIASNLTLVADGKGGEQIIFVPTPPTNITISSGITQSNIVVTSGSFLDILSGGTAVSATVLLGGSATAEIGGVDSGSTISAGGFETVSGSATGDQVYGTQLVSASTAIVSNETVYNGGSIDLFLKGVVGNNLTADSGGFININGNVVANNAVISGGVVDLQSPKATLGGTLTFEGPGTLEVTGVTSPGFGDLAAITNFGTGDVVDVTILPFAGATLSTTSSGGNTLATVTNGASSQTYIFAGSVGSSLQLANDGNGDAEIVFTSSSTSSSTIITVSGGSTKSSLVVSGGIEVDVLSAGTLVSATVLSNGSARIELGGVDTGITVSSGGTETVLGSATSSMIDGLQIVQSGGTVSNATILSGGSGVIQVGATDSGSTISAGGNETVLGSASGDQVYGTQLVSAGTAIVSNETVYNGGNINLFLKGVTANNLIANSGGTININGFVVANNTVINGGVLDLQSAKATLSGTLLFEGAGTLEVTAATSSGFGDQAVISGFNSSDVIDLTLLGSGATLSTSVSGGNTVATVTSSGVSDTFIFAGSIGSNLALVNSGGITEVMVTCFVAGTHIATPNGEVPIEHLVVGDHVLVAGPQRGIQTIRWIGHRRINVARHTAPAQVLPIRIECGAFGDGLPQRTLLLSPDHAVFADGVLVPVRYLVNGTTIRQLAPTAMSEVMYYHLELPQHDVVLAEGLTVESYLDTGNRSRFSNGVGPIDLHPDFSTRVWEAAGCAPLCIVGEQVNRLRSRLARIAAEGSFVSPNTAAACFKKAG